jgi:tRNA-specific 2-thiouridylase
MKAIALTSGGLDSLLSAKLIAQQGIDVTAVYFFIPFYLSFKKQDGNLSAQKVRSHIESLGITFLPITVGEEFLSLLIKPKHGFGAQMNPCIDCRIFMLRKSKELMADLGASFLVSGEVVGQRPMSQHKATMLKIEKEAGVEGLVVRPLCAQLLPETIPETRQWIARDKLYNFNGRSRRPQMELAKKLGITGYPNAAGGCLLTESSFIGKVRDLIVSGGLSLPNVELLKVGRHFRLSETAKVVVGRDQEENLQLVRLACSGDYIIMPPEEIAGATALVRGVLSAEVIKCAAALAARYCDTDQGAEVTMTVKKVDGDTLLARVVPMPEQKIAQLRI